MNPVQESNIKWAVRKMLDKHFNINTNDVNISLSSSGCRIFIKNMVFFFLLPSEGESPMEIAKNVIFQLKEKYPELSL